MLTTEQVDQCKKDADFYLTANFGRHLVEIVYSLVATVREMREEAELGNAPGWCAAIERILDGKDDGSGSTSEPWESVRRRLITLAAECRRSSRQAAASEIDRLTAALHAARAHPDYTYSIVPCLQTTISQALGHGGWERNQEYQCGPNDECWRRRKP